MPPFAKIFSGLTLAGAVVLLAGCSEYLDRRDTVLLSDGDAVATDMITQMVDPWPRAAADRNIAFSGVRMQSAMERYRTNKIIEPQSMDTTSDYKAPGAEATPQTTSNGAK